MPRKRTPSPEQQTEDRNAIGACGIIIDTISRRYPGRESLTVALRCLKEFNTSDVQQPKPRTRKPKAQPVVEMAHAE
jgi:hypothetical protein